MGVAAAMQWQKQCRGSSIGNGFKMRCCLMGVIRVCEQVDLAALALDCQVMAELALEAFRALPRSEVLTHY